MPNTFRAAVIGATRRGGYGHGLDTAFRNLTNVQLVAVADDDPQGLDAAGRRLKTTSLYADYREMLAREKPEIVSIGPRWVTERVAMVTAAAQAGCHIYCEKPLAGDLIAADAVIAACRQARVKLAVAHQFRAMPPVRQALRDLHAGKYGKVLRIHARPKDDHRGGGEELIVHGTHLLDLMIAVAGPPRWVSGEIAVGDRPAKRDDARVATEPLGPVCGDSLSAMFGFDGGIRGFFDSTANLHQNDRSLYGLTIECSQARLCFRSPGDVFVYPAPQIVPENPELKWEQIWIQDWHFTPEHLRRNNRDWLDRGNQALVTDLIDSIGKEREPLASGRDAHLAIEMVQGVYASHFAGGTRLSIPLENRQHPLA